MGELTIPARDVADAVGLPPVWHSIHGRGNTGEGWVRPGLQWDHHDNVDLTDPQTAFGVALQLDAWERASGSGDSWAFHIGLRVDDSGSDWANLIGAMGTRIQQIARHHRISRALGVVSAHGHLPYLSLKTPDDDDPWWLWTRPEGAQVTDGAHPQVVFLSRPAAEMAPMYRVVPTLAGVTDPAEALRLIDEHMQGVSPGSTVEAPSSNRSSS